MNQSEKNLSPEESLKLIQQTIEIAKKSVQENGFHLLLWGTLVVIASISDFYFDLTQGSGNRHFAWAVMPLIGLPIALIYEIRRSNERKSRNIIGNWYGLIWLGYGITLPMLIAFAVRNEVYPTPGILAITAFSVFVSGVVLRFRPLIWGAIAIWAGTVACLVVSPMYYSLIMAICIALGYLIPGYLLNRQQNA